MILLKLNGQILGNADKVEVAIESSLPPSVTGRYLSTVKGSVGVKIAVRNSRVPSILLKEPEPFRLEIKDEVYRLQLMDCRGVHVTHFPSFIDTITSDLDICEIMFVGIPVSSQQRGIENSLSTFNRR